MKKVYGGSLTGVAVLGVLLLPLGAALYRAYVQAGYSGWAWDSTLTYTFVSSLLLGLCVSLLSTLTALAASLLFVHFDVPLRRFWMMFGAVCFVIPPFTIAEGWLQVMGELSGETQRFAVTAWVLGVTEMPIAFLILYDALRRVPASLKEAALLYTDRVGMLRRIVLPMTAPAAALSMILTFILAFGEYSVANVTGYHDFAIAFFVRYSAFYDFSGALQYALLIGIVATAAALWIGRTRLMRIYAMEISHDMLRYPLSFGKTGIVLFLLFIYMLCALWWPLGKLWQYLEGGAILQACTMLYVSLMHTLLYGGAAALSIATLAVILAWMIRMRQLACSNAITAAALLMFALPPALTATGLITLRGTLLPDVLYDSGTVLVLGYVIVLFAVGFFPVRHAVDAVALSQLEAAQLAGASHWQNLRIVVLPQVWRTLAVVIAVSVWFIYRDSTLSMMLYPPGKETLSVYLLTSMANGKKSLIAAEHFVAAIVAVIPLLWFLRSREWYR